MRRNVFHTFVLVRQTLKDGNRMDLLRAVVLVEKCAHLSFTLKLYLSLFLPLFSQILMTLLAPESGQ